MRSVAFISALITTSLVSACGSDTSGVYRDLVRLEELPKVREYIQENKFESHEETNCETTTECTLTIFVMRRDLQQKQYMTKQQRITLQFDSSGILQSQKNEVVWTGP